MRVKASAPAKVILFGEHFVVYNRPAIVAAIERKVYVSAELIKEEAVYIRSDDLGISGFFRHGRFIVEKGGEDAELKLKPIWLIADRLLSYSRSRKGLSIKIKSDVPVEAGLGSSAAVASASAYAINKLLNLNLSKDEIFRLAYESERLIHGTPSGIDPAVSTYGGLIYYVKDKGMSRLNVNLNFNIVIGDTGVPRSTGELVANVRELKRKYPSLVGSILKVSDIIIEEAVEALKSGDLKVLGELMNVNQGILSAVGVSSVDLERLIYAARDAGAYGAKLTGAGGGGCMIALAPPKKVDDIVEAIRRAGGSAFTARMAKEGVRVEGETDDS